MLNIEEQYKKRGIPNLMKAMGYKNKMEVPRLVKVVINCGFGGKVAGKNLSERKKIGEEIKNVLSSITGQAPAICSAKKSESAFKLRKGLEIGAKVTLRGKKSYDFLAKLIGIVLPRTRDFKGLNLKSVDKQGNLTVGFKDYSPFPEVKVGKEKNLFGFEITAVTSVKNREEGIAFLKELGVPFKKQ